ncbi:MAG TPA: tetratricopeptide repeat protein [Vicinamibacterales bacterium]|nr:tetratricopeptide repeat protein [Vicinamibacterales bacterium]
MSRRATRRTRGQPAKRTTAVATGGGRAGVALALVALVWWTFRDVGSFAYLAWDDPVYVRDNVNVLAGLSWSNVAWAFTTGHDPYWHPLTWLSHMLDVTMFGRDAGGPHVVNALLHAANTMLVFYGLVLATGAVGRSAFVGAMFAVHPAHVESVAWIAERKDVLSTFLLLLSVLAYGAYVKGGRPRWYGLSLAFFAAAAMAKPMVVTLPVLLLLLDVWPLRRVPLARDPAWRRVVVDKLPFLGLAIAVSVLTVAVQFTVGAMPTLESLPAAPRLSNVVIGYVRYLDIAFRPVGLAAFYPMREASVLITALSLMMLCGVTWVSWTVRRRFPYVLVGWAWFVIGVLPVSGLLQAGEQGVADRFLYVPILGLLVIVAWGTVSAAERIGLPRAAVGAAAAAVVAISTWLARDVVPSWSNDLTLWTRATQVVAGNYRAYENLGDAQRDAGRLDDARASYELALIHKPAASPRFEAVVRTGLGVVAAAQNRLPQAREEFGEAVRLDPKLAEARANLAGVMASSGDLAAAEAEFRAAIALAPDVAAAHVGLGNVLLGQQKSQAALAEYEQAARLSPEIAEAHNGKCAALITQAEYQKAIDACMEARRLKPDLATAELNLGIIYLRKGDVTSARRHLREALRIDPTQPQARAALESIR